MLPAPQLPERGRREPGSPSPQLFMGQRYEHCWWECQESRPSSRPPLPDCLLLPGHSHQGVLSPRRYKDCQDDLLCRPQTHSWALKLPRGGAETGAPTPSSSKPPPWVEAAYTDIQILNTQVSLARKAGSFYSPGKGRWRTSPHYADVQTQKSESASRSSASIRLVRE